MFLAAWRTFVAGFAGGFALLARGPRRYVPWIVGSALFGIPMALAPANATPDGLASPALILGGGTLLVAFTLSFFVMADVVRVYRPDARMTPARLAIAMLLLFLTWLATNIAGMCFYVPAFYVGVKLSLWVPYALLENGGQGQEIEAGLRRSWLNTTGAYWETLMVCALPFTVYVLALFAASVPFDYTLYGWHPLALVGAPIGVALVLYAIAAAYAVWFHWAVELQSRVAQTVLVPQGVVEPGT